MIVLTRDELAEIERTGYPGACDSDHNPERTSEAVNRFVSDMIVCLDRTG